MTIANEITLPPLHEMLEQIRNAETLDAAIAAIELAVRGLGFEKFAVFEWQGAQGVCAVHHNTPGAWSSSNEALTMHPTIRAAMSSPIPFAWDRATYTAAHADPLWEKQAAHGLTAGLCAAYGPHDARACIVVTAQPGCVPPTGSDLYKLFGTLLLVTGECYTVLKRLAPARKVQTSVKLRPREIECLQWVLLNKTAWEIGMILGISERTVNQHLERARQQLDACNSIVAATRATQLQLLPQPNAA